MTDYKEILRLKNLGFSNHEVAAAIGCGRNTITRTLQRAESAGISWHKAKEMSAEELRRHLFPSSADHSQYRMPDYEKIHREMQKSGVTLSLLWVEYCEECRANGELPYQSTQFNKYYGEYVHKTNSALTIGLSSFISFSFRNITLDNPSRFGMITFCLVKQTSREIDYIRLKN